MNISIRYQSNEADAKSIVNKVFIKILDNLSKYRVDDSFKSWISRICVNANIDEYRKIKSRKSKEVSVGEFYESQSVANKGVNDLDAAHLHSFIAQLPKTSKEVFLLFAVDGYKHKEISEMLGISENASRWHVNEARKKLKVKIKTFYEKHKINMYE